MFSRASKANIPTGSEIARTVVVQACLSMIQAEWKWNNFH